MARRARIWALASGAALVTVVLYLALREEKPEVRVRSLGRADDLLGMHCTAIAITNAGTRQLSVSFIVEELSSNAWQQAFFQSNLAFKERRMFPETEMAFSVPTPEGRWRVNVTCVPIQRDFHKIIRAFLGLLRIERPPPKPILVMSEMPPK